MKRDLEYIENEEFDQLKELQVAEYEDCVFRNCSFNEADLSGFVFSDCEFVDCDLSMVKIDGCSFKDVCFTNCKLLGVRFEDCNSFLLKMRFDNCLLNMASFYKMKLPGQVFNSCSLHDCDFTECDLSKAHFAETDLSGAIFNNSNLSNANLLTAKGYSINPTQNDVKNARFSTDGLMGLLHFAGIKVD